MKRSTTPHALVSHSSVVAGQIPAPGVPELLRSFDTARRELSRRVARCEGLGAGYDRLQVYLQAIETVTPGDTVTVSAMLIEERPERHQVEYVATAIAGLGDLNATVRCEVLAHATGWTLVGARPQPSLAWPIRNREKDCEHVRTASG